MNKVITRCALALLTLTVVATPYAAVAQGKVKPAETNLIIALAGTAFNGIVPKGKSQYRANAKKASFEVEAERVNLPNGTVLNVKLNGGQFGTMTVALRRASFELESKKGAVPTIKQGDWVSICDANGVVLLSGKF